MDIISKFTVGSEEGISDLISIKHTSFYTLHKEFKSRIFSTAFSYFGAED